MHHCPPVHTPGGPCWCTTVPLSAHHCPWRPMLCTTVPLSAHHCPWRPMLVHHCPPVHTPLSLEAHAGAPLSPCPHTTVPGGPCCAPLSPCPHTTVPGGPCWCTTVPPSTHHCPWRPILVHHCPPVHTPLSLEAHAGAPLSPCPHTTVPGVPCWCTTVPTTVPGGPLVHIGSCHCELEVKGRHLGLGNFQVLGSKFVLVFLVLQPRSDTLEGYNPLVGAALLYRHICQPLWVS